MKLVAVTGSPRGQDSQTLRLVKAVVAGVGKAGATVDIIDLGRLTMEYCTACETCHKTGTCIHHDDLVKVRTQLLAADGILMASPTYFRSVTAQMKTLLDRMSDVIHCQLFDGKYACSLSTSGGPGCEQTVQYLDEILVSLGAYVVGHACVSLSSGPKAFTDTERKATDLGREWVEAVRTRRVYPEQQQRHTQMAAYFHQLVKRNQAHWPYEYGVWEKKSP